MRAKIAFKSLTDKIGQNHENLPHNNCCHLGFPSHQNVSYFRNEINICLRIDSHNFSFQLGVRLLR